MNINFENIISMSQSDCEATFRGRSIHKKRRILNFRWELYIIKATRSGEKINWEVHDLQISENVKKLRKIGRKWSTNDFYKKRFRKKKNIAITKKYNEFEYMQINISINKKRSRTIINSSASRNFLATRYANYRNLSIRRKNIVYSLASMNGSAINIEWIKNKITIHLSIQRYHENVIFDVIKLISYDIILDIL